jgi:hypothetical protein
MREGEHLNKLPFLIPLCPSEAQLFVAAFYWKESGRKFRFVNPAYERNPKAGKLVPKFNARGETPIPQSVMSPRQRGAPSSLRSQLGATLNALEVRPPHLPKFRDQPGLSYLLFFQAREIDGGVRLSTLLAAPSLVPPC